MALRVGSWISSFRFAHPLVGRAPCSRATPTSRSIHTSPTQVIIIITIPPPLPFMSPIVSVLRFLPSPSIAYLSELTSSRDIFLPMFLPMFLSSFSSGARYSMLLVIVLRSMHLLRLGRERIPHPLCHLGLQCPQWIRTEANTLVIYPWSAGTRRPSSLPIR